jgi:hypothetical protein
MIKDNRCPCLICAVQIVCTEYCTRFHYYRKLVLAEIDFFISQAIEEYNKGQDATLMSEIRRDLVTAHEENIRQGLDKYDEYIILRDKLFFLESRFDMTIQNSRIANRGVMTRLENEDEDT